jgi:tetratricopeptide (TPR) repeat protein
MAANKARVIHCSLVIYLLAFLYICPVPSLAQFGPLSDSAGAPQARSQEELDAYLQIVVATRDRDIISEADNFAAQFPKSELLGVADQYQMHAYERTGDFDGMLAAGRKSLANAPNNLDALLTLAPEIANHFSDRPDRAQLLTEADRYAHLALDGLDKVRPPHDVSLDDWDKQKRAMQCQAHEVLGVVAVSQGRREAEIVEFQTVVQLAAAPAGAQYFRLALALASDGKEKEAAEYFHRAADLGPEPVRKLALRELDKQSNEKPSH